MDRRQIIMSCAASSALFAGKSVWSPGRSNPQNVAALLSSTSPNAAVAPPKTRLQAAEEMVNSETRTAIAQGLRFLKSRQVISGGFTGAFGTNGYASGTAVTALAGLAFMVIVFYLRRRNKPIMFALVPMIVMLIMPAWAMLWNMFNTGSGWYYNPDKQHLFLFAIAVLALQIWMMVEGILVWTKSKGLLEEQLPALPVARTSVATSSAGGSN